MINGARLWFLAVFIACRPSSLSLSHTHVYTKFNSPWVQLSWRSTIWTCVINLSPGFVVTIQHFFLRLFTEKLPGQWVLLQPIIKGTNKLTYRNSAARNSNYLFIEQVGWGGGGVLCWWRWFSSMIWNQCSATLCYQRHIQYQVLFIVQNPTMLLLALRT